MMGLWPGVWTFLREGGFAAIGHKPADWQIQRLATAPLEPSRRAGTAPASGESPFGPTLARQRLPPARTSSVHGRDAHATWAWASYQWRLARDGDRNLSVQRHSDLGSRRHLNIVSLREQCAQGPCSRADCRSDPGSFAATRQGANQRSSTGATTDKPKNSGWTEPRI
jgi:hypothetical protein